MAAAASVGDLHRRVPALWPHKGLPAGQQDGADSLGSGPSSAGKPGPEHPKGTVLHSVAAAGSGDPAGGLVAVVAAGDEDPAAVAVVVVDVDLDEGQCVVVVAVGGGDPAWGRAAAVGDEDPVAGRDVAVVAVGDEDPDAAVAEAGGPGGDLPLLAVLHEHSEGQKDGDPDSA